MNNKVIVLGGPTGCGESTVTRELIERHPEFSRLVTATTRLPRLQEKHGIDYYFFESNDEFKKAIEGGLILEHTYVPNRDAYYGSFKPDLDERFEHGDVVITNHDVVGAKYFKEHFDAVTIFIEPTSLQELEGRLKSRDPNISDEELQKRLKAAQHEIETERDFYDYHVTNADGKLEEALAEIQKILIGSGYIEPQNN